MRSISLVTICIPVYNGAHQIARALDACLAQTYQNIEILVLDNASTDSLPELMRMYNDSRIRYVRMTQHVPMSDNFLRAYQFSRGEYIHHLNHDDWLEPSCIERKVRLFERYPQSAFISGSIATYRAEGVSLANVSTVAHRDGFYSKSYVLSHFYRQNGLIGLFCMARRQDFLEAFQPTVSNAFGYEHYFKKGLVIDTHFLLKILRKYDGMYYDSHAVYNGLTHANNASKHFFEKTRQQSSLFLFQHINLIGFESFFIQYEPTLLFGYRTYVGAHFLASLVIDTVTRGHMLHFKEVKVYFSSFFLLELIAVFLYSVPVFFQRFCVLPLKRAIKKTSHASTIHNR